MKITIYGAGYVGLVTAVCLASIGHQVVCFDVDKDKITKLKQGESVIFEERLSLILKAQLKSGNLFFTNNFVDAIKHSALQMIAVGTPGLPDGQADLSQVFALAAEVVNHVSRDMILIIKSTVTVGTGNRLEKYIKDQLASMGKDYTIDVVVNPEFFCEGRAIDTFMHADRIVIGGSKRGTTIVKALYKKLIHQGIPVQCMSKTSAELTKYAANAMLACKISFINQISQIAEKVGANIDDVKSGISLDHRIGPYFLQAGIGYGGSCFPKDIRALAKTAQLLNLDSSLLDAIDKVNNLQKKWAISCLLQHFKNNLQGLTIGIWGVAFKPGTDDIREASSLVIIEALLQYDVQMRIYDPLAMPNARLCFPGNKNILWCESQDEVFTSQIDALIIDTEWEIFKNYSLAILHEKLVDAPIIDGRNCFALSNVIQAGIRYYYSVGRVF